MSYLILNPKGLRTTNIENYLLMPVLWLFPPKSHNFQYNSELTLLWPIPNSAFTLGALSIPGFKSSDKQYSPLHFYRRLPISTYAIHSYALTLDFVTAQCCSTSETSDLKFNSQITKLSNNRKIVE